MRQASMVNIPIKARLSGFYFFYFAVVGAFMPYWSLYLEGRGFNKEQIGWLAAITVISRIIAPSVWGYCADRYGLRMRWVRLGIVAELIAWIAILFIPHTMFWLILVLFFIVFSKCNFGAIRSGDVILSGKAEGSIRNHPLVGIIRIYCSSLRFRMVV